MKKVSSLASFLLIIVTLTIIARSLKPAKYQNKIDYSLLGGMPAQADGRLKPLDTIARNNLVLISGKSTYKDENYPSFLLQLYRLAMGLENPKTKLTAIEWLTTLLFDPITADKMKVFRIDHPGVLGLFNWKQDRKYFSMEELIPHLGTLESQQKQSNPEPKLRNSFEKAINQLYQVIGRYRALSFGIFDPNSLDRIETDLEDYLSSIIPGLKAFDAQKLNKPFDSDALKTFASYLDRHLRLSRLALFSIAPQKNSSEWRNTGESLIRSAKVLQIDPVVLAWQKVAVSYRNQNYVAMNQDLLALKEHYQKNMLEKDFSQVVLEQRFNMVSPFTVCLILYLVIFLAVLLYWLFSKEKTNRSFLLVLGTVFLIHTAGLVIRMILSGRPPVTNLYSSAIFVGWAAILLGIILEWIFRNGIGGATAAVVGFLSLLIARYLELSGDTLEMLQAVLDTNFWLATHVVVITMGYSAVFLAGFLGLFYVFLGVFTRRLDSRFRQSLNRMVYGTTCFGLLFSFVGTMLGGIWADQSWGRFWGWDPKENGALLLVLWGALMLHARWGGMVREKGFMLLAIGGNIITAWSWFGTNMLGVGLHAYGFMDKAFIALLTFVFSQMLVIGVGVMLPRNQWKSSKLVNSSKAS